MSVFCGTVHKPVVFYMRAKPYVLRKRVKRVNLSINCVCVAFVLSLLAVIVFYANLIGCLCRRLLIK